MGDQQASMNAFNQVIALEQNPAADEPRVRVGVLPPLTPPPARRRLYEFFNFNPFFPPPPRAVPRPPGHDIASDSARSTVRGAVCFLFFSVKRTWLVGGAERVRVDQILTQSP